MSIPLNTSTGTILRFPSTDADGNALDSADPVEPAVIKSGIRAVVSGLSGSAVYEGANRGEIDAQLTADPCDLRPGDLWRDDTQGVTYRVAWANRVSGLDGDLAHTVGGLAFSD